MKKFLVVLGLGATLAFAGCKSATNTNANVNLNLATPTPMATATVAAPAVDAATKSTVESALTKAGITGVTVDATTSAVTLRGSVAKGKMAEAVKIAQEAGKKPVKNELTEK